MDYYIRSWDPDSTYPANPQEGDVCYTITLDQSWSPVAGVKNDNLVKEEVYQSGEWKEVGGGGVGGDTVTVTVTHVPPEGQEMKSAYAFLGVSVDNLLYRTDDMSFSESISVPADGYLLPTGGEVTEGYVAVAENGLEVVSGDAEIVDSDDCYGFIAHGDCAVKITWQWD